MTSHEEVEYLAALLWQQEAHPERGFHDRPDAKEWHVVPHLERLIYRTYAASLIFQLDSLRTGRVLPLTEPDRSPST